MNFNFNLFNSTDPVNGETGFCTTENPCSEDQGNTV